MFISVAFFLLQPLESESVWDAVVNQSTAEISTVSDSLGVAKTTSNDSTDIEAADPAIDIAGTPTDLMTNLPKMMFVMLPLFALLPSERIGDFPFLMLPAYLFFASRRVCGKRIAKTMLETGTLSLTYGFLLILGIVAVLFAAAVLPHRRNILAL